MSKQPSNFENTKKSSFKTKALTIVLTIAMLSSLFQMNLFAYAKNGDEAMNTPTSELSSETTSTNEDSTNEDDTSNDTNDDTSNEDTTGDDTKTDEDFDMSTSAEAHLQAFLPTTFSLSSPKAAEELSTITYYSNYPADSGLTDKEYIDPIEYSSEMTATAATLLQADFETPENYYILGWNPSPDAGTAQYPEGDNLGKIGVDWHLYAVWMPYKTMNWTITDSSYTSTYNAQSHTNSITWPTVYSSAWAGDVIPELTYEYSVNGGAFSSEKPELIDAGDYTVTVKASGYRYTTTTTTVSVKINKAPLVITPDMAASYAYGSLVSIPYVLPAVNEANGPKSQADETALNTLFANTNPLFDAFDSSNLLISDLATALPDQYTVKINSAALANLQTNQALKNYTLSAGGDSFTITALSGLSVSADPLNTIYDSQNHSALSNVQSSLTFAKIEYSIDGAPFSTTIPEVKNAGSYNIEIRATAPGYTTATITLTAVVEKRDITLDIDSYRKTVGQGDPTFSAAFSGLQGSDTIGYTLSREVGEGVGTYAITATLVTDNNYNVTVNEGILTISAASVITRPTDPDPDPTPTNPDTTTDDPDPTEPQTVAPTVPQIDTTPDDTDENTPESEPEQEPTPLPGVDDSQGPSVNIEDATVPLANASGTWSLLNLILTVANTLISLVLVIGYFTGKRKDDEYQEQQKEETLKRKGFERVVSIIVALASVVLFIVTQDMRLDMVFIDRWSFIMVITTVVQIIVSVLSKKRWEKNVEETYATA